MKMLSGAIESHAVRGPGDIRSMFGGQAKAKTSDTVFKANLVLVDDVSLINSFYLIYFYFLG